MKQYERPMVEEILIVTDDILDTSGIEVNNTNAGFNPDERL